MNQCLIMIEMTKTSTIVFTMKNGRSMNRKRVNLKKTENEEKFHFLKL